jgi:predicted RNA-binding protein YlxR (DUF448 family)
VRVADSNAAAGFAIKVDNTGKLRGRGANITPNLAAFDIAIKTKALERALRLERKLTASELAQLRQEFANAIYEREFRQGQKKVTLKVSRQEFEQKVGN